MPKGKPGSRRSDLPRPFRARFDPTRRQWGVIQGDRWRFAGSLCIQVTTLSHGDELTGVGVVRTEVRGTIVVTA
jgi:hypothetical protein